MLQCRYAFHYLTVYPSYSLIHVQQRFIPQILYRKALNAFNIYQIHIERINLNGILIFNYSHSDDTYCFTV